MAEQVCPILRILRKHEPREVHVVQLDADVENAVAVSVLVGVLQKHLSVSGVAQQQVEERNVLLS